MNARSLLSNLKSPRNRRQRYCRFIIVALLIYTIVGFFVAPAIIKWQMLKRLPAITHRHAAVQKVRVNPYALSLTIRGLSLTETNGTPFAGFDELYVNFQLSSLFRQAWTFSDITLIHPTADIVRDAKGQFNFDNLFTSPPHPATTNQSSSLPTIIVQHLVVTNGNVAVTDQTRARPFRADYGPVDVELTDFTTRRDRNGPYSFVATAGDGERFAWSGTVSVNPPRSTGQFELFGIPLKKYAPYLADFTSAEIAGGVLGITASYHFEAQASPVDVELTNAAVKVTNLEIQSPDVNETLLKLPDLSVTGGSASLAARQVRVARIALNGGGALVRRDPDGRLNWLKLLVAQTKERTHASAAAPKGATLPWTVRLDEFDTKAFNLTLEDRTTPSPAQFGLDNLHTVIKDVSNLTNTPIAALVDFHWHGGGTVHVEGGGTLLPPAGEAQISITNLALPPLQPYVGQLARLVVNSGDLNLNGRADYSPGGTPQIQFTGDASITNFDTMDTIAYHDLARWDDLNLRGIRFSLQTNSLDVDEVKFSRLETSLTISTNGQISVLGLLREKKTGSETKNAVAPETAVASSSIPIRIGALTFEKCSFGAVDQSLEPRFNTSIQRFGGTIRDLTFPGLARAAIDIRGKVSDISPFDIAGTVTPDLKNPFVDLTVAFTNTDLTPFDPYSAKYVGRPLAKGKLTLALHYSIAERKLKADNIVLLDQLTFGARNQSTYATKLPVKLAVALLKDRNGRIDLNLPVSGTLDDPQFSISGLVWKAVKNILVKAATSPFSLLGAMFGGGEELQYVDFPPGQSTLGAAQTNKLDTLAKALYERPTLTLEIGASADLATDREALALQKLRDKMKSLCIHELTTNGAALPPDFVFTDADYVQMLRKTYDEEFKPAPEAAVHETNAVAVVTNSAAKAAGVTTAIVPSREPQKGATLLMQMRPRATAPKPAQVKAATPSSPPPVAPQTENTLTRKEMEQRLVAKFPVTDDDLRELIRQRAEAVQKFLLATGKVTADRLFLIAPKPIIPSVKGQARATFSLD